jgi:outer membrane PBP1 activator LpoA protein
MRHTRKWTLLRAFAIGCALALLASCASVQVDRPQTQAGVSDPTFAQPRELARKDATLAGQERSDNARAIDRLLAGLDDATLAREAAALPVGDPLYNFAGRALQRRGLPLPRPFDRGAWKFDAGNRPPADRDGYRPPVKLAVLLPLSGTLAAAAAPVRDGLLTGYYGETRRRPEIAFYDTATGAEAAYAKAVAEGNDFVLGPLGREEVGALFRSGNLAVPVLALNRGSVAPPAGSASFSLSPDDEGIAAAEYLLDRGARHVLVLAGSDEGLRRAVAAFRDRFGEHSGATVQSIDVGGAATDLIPRLQAATQQGGVDAVFFAVKGSEARMIAPQLAAAGLGAKPRVATSQLLSGTGKPGEDSALDGIAYPTETWTARGIPALPSAASVGARLKTAKGPAARLFALGYDAWLVTAYLEKLALDANAEVRGATGTLRIDGFGNVLRTPTWSTFSGGTPVPLADGAR